MLTRLDRLRTRREKENVGMVGRIAAVFMDCIVVLYQSPSPDLEGCMIVM